MKKGMFEMFVDVKIVFVVYLQNQLIFSSFENLNLNSEKFIFEMGIFFCTKFHQGQSNLSHKVLKFVICTSTNLTMMIL